MEATTLRAFADELQKIAAAKEKDAEGDGFRTFLGGAGKMLRGGISSEARAAPVIQKTLARGAGGGVAVVGHTAARQALPSGPLNLHGGFH